MNETREITSIAVKALNRVPDVAAYRMNSGVVPTRGGFMHGAPAGTPDILAIVLGHAVWIETKTPVGELSETQKTEHRRLQRLGHLVFVARSSHEAVEFVMGVRATLLKEARQK